MGEAEDVIFARERRGVMVSDEEMQEFLRIKEDVERLASQAVANLRSQGYPDYQKISSQEGERVAWQLWSTWEGDSRVFLLGDGTIVNASFNRVSSIYTPSPTSGLPLDQVNSQVKSVRDTLQHLATFRWP